MSAGEGIRFYGLKNEKTKNAQQKAFTKEKIKTWKNKQKQTRYLQASSSSVALDESINLYTLVYIYQLEFRETPRANTRCVSIRTVYMHAHAELPKENTLSHGKIGDREQLSVQPLESRERFVFIRITIRNPCETTVYITAVSHKLLTVSFILKRF